MRQIANFPEDAVLTISTGRNHRPLFFSAPSHGDFYLYEQAIGESHGGLLPKASMLRAALQVYTMRTNCVLGGPLAGELIAMVHEFYLTHKRGQIASSYIREIPAEPKPMFDAYEIHPVVCSSWIDGGGDYIEQCEQSDNLESATTYAVEMREQLESTANGVWDVTIIWTLYGHISGDGVEAISDVATEEDALDLLYKITGITGTKGSYAPYWLKR